MKTFVNVFIFHIGVLICFPLLGQSEWSHFLARGDSHEVEIFGNTAYVANRSGLLQIDLDNNQETLIHPANHTVEVQGFTSLELLENGDMWLTSSKGHLYYYDGTSFTKHLDSLKHITNLIYADNKLWFFTSVIFDQSDLYSYDGISCINHGDLDIYGTTKDKNDRFWYATRDSISQFNGDSILETHAMPSDIYLLHDYFIDSEDKHWFSYGTIPHLMLYDNGQWEETYTSHFVQKFYELEVGQVSAVLQNNKYVELSDALEEEKEIFQNLPEDFLILDMISTDSYWFTTEKMFHSSRLFRSTPNGLTEFMANDDIIPATIVDLEQECNGQLITSTRTFLNRYKNDDWEAIPYETNGKDCYLSRFVNDNFSCEIGVAPSFINAAFSCQSIWQLLGDTLFELEILPKQELYLHRDINKNILFTSTYPGKIHQIDTLGNETIIPVPGSLAAASIHLLEEDKMAVLSYRDSIDFGQSIRILENNEWSELNLDSLEIPDMLIGIYMAEDNDGHLWIHEEKGLIEYDGQDLTYYPFEEDVFHSYTGVMVEDNYGSFWMSTSENGLIRWTGDSTIVYNTKNSEILSNLCRELQIIDDHLWVNHYFGLSKIKIDPIGETSETVDLQNLQYKVYPNPSTGNLTITNPVKEIRTIEVFTIDGIPVYKSSNNHSECMLGLESGVYILKLKQKQIEVFEKIIIVD